MMKHVTLTALLLPALAAAFLAPVPAKQQQGASREGGRDREGGGM